MPLLREAPSLVAAAAPAGAAAAAIRPLRIADVTVFYGQRSGGIRTYLQAKAAYAAATGAFEHTVIVPGRLENSNARTQQLKSIPVNGANGYRVPLGGAELKATLTGLRPDVVLLHDPFWTPRAATGAAHDVGARVVAVHHSSAAQAASALGRTGGLCESAFRRWYRRAYEQVDAVMSVIDPRPDCGRPATLALRLGLDPAFVPAGRVRRGEHVLYVGRLAREKGLRELLEAAAAAREPWPLVLRGAGPGGDALLEYARKLRIADRVSIAPFLTDRSALARAYSRASCVVVPGMHETFGLVALEAAASGARVVGASSTPSMRLIGDQGEVFRPGDAADLARAIERARARPAAIADALALGARHSWSAALGAELEDLRRLTCR